MSATRESPERNVFLATFALLSLLVFALKIWIIFPQQASDSVLNDFSIFLESGKHFIATGELYTRTGQPELSYAPDQPIYKFPPAFQLTITPLLASGLTSQTIVWITRGVFLVCYLLAVWLLLRELRSSYRSIMQNFLAIVIVIASLYTPFFEALLNVHIEIIIFTLLAIAFCLQDRTPLLAGIALGIAAMLKIYPAFLLVVPALQRQWRVLAGFALACGAIIIVSIGYFGMTEMNFYIQQLVPILASQVPVAHSQNLALEKLLHDVGLWPQLSGKLQLAVTVITLACIAFVAKRPAQRKEMHNKHAPALVFSLGICAMLLWLPNYWLQYQMALLIPVFTLAACVIAQPTRLMAVGLSLVLFICIFPYEPEIWLADQLATVMNEPQQHQEIQDILQQSGIISLLWLKPQVAGFALLMQLCQFITQLKALLPVVLFSLLMRFALLSPASPQ